jgi:hypothetical protein
MNISEYKTTTLARSDVFDIVGFEQVERMPNPDKKAGGYVQVVQTTESGKKITKYDVHLMREIDGLKKFDKEHFAVINEGLADEEVVFTQPKTVDRSARVASRLERYINNLPYLNVSDMEIDGEAKNARFTALKDNGDSTATEIEVYAYIKGIKGEQNQEVHVEITK